MTRLRLHADLSAMAFDDRFHDRQAEAGTALLAAVGRIGLGEFLVGVEVVDRGKLYSIIDQALADTKPAATTRASAKR